MWIPIIQETWQIEGRILSLIIYVNNAPVIWYNKLRNTVEASIFLSYFFLRISKNIIEAL